MALNIQGFASLAHPLVTPSRIQAVEPLTQSKESQNQLVEKHENDAKKLLKRGSAKAIKKIDPKKLLNII